MYIYKNKFMYKNFLFKINCLFVEGEEERGLFEFNSLDDYCM